jgi:hypothetical protein
MIHDHGFPMFLWAEECNTTIYVQKNTPHRILGENTPMEAFSGVKPKIGYFKIFGCTIYIHVPMEKRMKIEPLGKKGIFVGYKDTSKDYMIFIPVKRKTIMSRDVKFDDKFASKRS